MIGSSSDSTLQVVDKALSKIIMQRSKISCPAGQIVTNMDEIDYSRIILPCVVKPTTTENSVGISLVRSMENLPKALEEAWKHSREVIIEQFIAGREVRCSVIREIDSQGKVNLVPMIPQEYKVRQHDLRTTEDKILMDKDGLPLGNYKQFFSLTILKILKVYLQSFLVGSYLLK